MNAVLMKLSRQNPILLSCAFYNLTLVFLSSTPVDLMDRIIIYEKSTDIVCILLIFGGIFLAWNYLSFQKIMFFI